MNTHRQVLQSDKTRRNHRPSPEFQTIPGNLWRIRIVAINDFEYCSPPEGMVVSRGDFVVVSTYYGKDLARILGPVGIYNDIDVDQIRLIVRIATERDIAHREHLAKQEKPAFELCQKRIVAFHLPMKLIDAHYILDERKVVFFFTADNRIDFRELVQDLANYFKMRIELRQISIRDSARVIGGLAVCGRDYCCHGLAGKLSPVSIKMVKEQNLSFNSLKISGACGRLLCCLDYEHDHYASERKKLPPQGSSITIGEVKYKVSEVKVFTCSVVLKNPAGDRIEVPSCRLVRRKGIWNVLPEDER